MQISVSESDLKNYLNCMPQDWQLPIWAEAEPGSVLYVFKEIWLEKQGSDQATVTQSKQRVISYMEGFLNRSVPEHRFNALFGGAVPEQKGSLVVPESEARAFLEALFKNWAVNPASNDNYDPIVSDLPVNVSLDDLARRLRDLLYESHIAVKCIPPEGIGVRGLLKQCRVKDASYMLSASPGNTVVMSDPVTGLLDWLEAIKIVFGEIDLSKCQRNMIWIFKEPVSLGDRSALHSLAGIGNLRMCFEALRLSCSGNNPLFQWEDISRKLMMAFYVKSPSVISESQKTKPSNDVRFSVNPDVVIPAGIPPKWRAGYEKQTLKDINIDVLIDEASNNNIELSYYLHESKPKGTTLSVLPQIDPGQEVNQNFLNLYRAVKSYNHYGGKEDQNILECLQSQGWKFMNAKEFLS